MIKILLRAGAVINLIMAVFHMFFWKLLDWTNELPKLSALNSGVFQIANIILIFVLLYFSLMSYLMSRSEELDFNGISIFACIIGFYLIRIFTGIIFFGFMADEVIVWIICALIAVLYGIVIYKDKKSIRNSNNIV